MFDFHKYPSIENITRTATVNQIYHHGFDKVEWGVLLKIHGANFSIWTDGKVIKAARRKAFLGDDDNFCNWQSVVNEIKDNILAAHNDLKKMYGNEITIFDGELAGGEYPHPEVKKPDHAVKVQKGVFYTPFNFFYMFDIQVDGKFINHDEVIDIGHTHGIIVAEYLTRGKFKDVIDYPNCFEDPLHKMFGLPSLGEDNVCEGVVLKPINPCFFGNGSRCILKNKNDKFKEKNGERKNKKPRPRHEWTEQGKKLYDELFTYITENRLRNVISHGLDLSDKKKAFGIIMKEMNQDVWDDFMKDYGDEFECLEKDEKKLIKKTLNPTVANLIRPVFQDILDGEF